MVEFYAVFTFVTTDAAGDVVHGTHVVFPEPETDAAHLEFGEYVECLGMTGTDFALVRHLPLREVGDLVALTGFDLVVRSYADGSLPVAA